MPSGERRRYVQVTDLICSRRNTLAFLPTGSGKTLISVLLIRHYLSQQRKRAQDKQLIAFIAPTKLLVDQQKAYIAGSCNAVVKAYTSETITSYANWSRELRGVDVFVATPEILRQALERRFLDTAQLSLVILDECHYATGKNPMSVVCELLKRAETQPRILGLTGIGELSLINCALISLSLAHCL